MIEDELLATGEMLPITEEQDLHELANRIDLIEAEINGPFGDLQDIVAEQGDDFAEQIGSILDERVAALDHDPDSYEEQEIILSTVESMDNPALRGWLSATDTTSIRARLNEAQTLHPIVEDLANREFHEARDKLLASAKWEQIIDRHTSGEDYPDLQGLFTALNGEIGSNTLDYKFAMRTTRELQDWQDRFAAQGDLGTETQLDLPEDWKPPADIPDRLRTWENSVRHVEQYLSPSRQEYVASIFPRDGSTALQNLCFDVGLYERARSSPDMVPPVIAEALASHADTLMQRFYSQDEASLKTALAERPNALFIGNQQLLRTTTGLTDVPAWIHQRMARFPDSVVSGIGFVNFANGLGKHVDDAGTTWSTQGTMNTSKNTLTIDIGSTPLTESDGLLKGRPDILEYMQNLNLLEIEETTDHELGHYIHFQRLSVAWLERWQAVINTEQVNVTAYVENMRTDSTANHHHADLEDLTDSLSLYLNRPWTLYTEAPERFALLNEWDGRYTQAFLDVSGQYLAAHTDASINTVNSVLRELADHNITRVQPPTNPDQNKSNAS